MELRFGIEQWSAWAPGLTDQTSWRAWLDQPVPLLETTVPPLLDMPAMMRRRVERLGRMALQAAYTCLGDAPVDAVVFASRYGDCARSVDLLSSLAQGEPLSPTSFSLSVHNAIAALFSIARADRSAYSAIAAGDETIEAAVIEALGQLADGKTRVLLVYFDEPLPAIHHGFQDCVEIPRGWALRLVRADAAGWTLQPALCADAEPVLNPHQPDARLSPDLAVLKFLLSKNDRLVCQRGERRWCWRYHA